LPTYESLDRQILKVDAVRYLYLYKYGGVYADLDMESLKPVDSVLHNVDLALGFMGSALDNDHSLPNAWMASRPGHSFWMHMINLIIKRSQDKKYERVESITGPMALMAAYREYMKLPEYYREPITLLDGEVVYPYCWYGPMEYRDYCSAQSDKFDPEKCKEKTVTPRSIAITYWSHSYEVNK
jgi:mannosyltransferase OCH1-like enzyme